MSDNLSSSSNVVSPGDDNKNFPQTVQIVCLLAQTEIFVQGKSTGQTYRFYLGNPVSVDISDAPEILARRSTHRICCSGKSDRQIFIQMKE